MDARCARVENMMDGEKQMSQTAGFNIHVQFCLKATIRLKESPHTVSSSLSPDLVTKLNVYGRPNRNANRAYFR